MLLNPSEPSRGKFTVENVAWNFSNPITYTIRLYIINIFFPYKYLIDEFPVFLSTPSFSLSFSLFHPDFLYFWLSHKEKKKKRVRGILIYDGFLPNILSLSAAVRREERGIWRIAI